MTLREDLLNLIKTLSDEQLAILMPLVLSIRGKEPEAFSSETSQAYQDWISTENDIYDKIFTNDLATR